MGVWSNNDLPKTGKTGKDYGPSSLKPDRGELFVRRKNGDVLLKQTNQLAGLVPENETVMGKVIRFSKKVKSGRRDGRP